MEGLYYCIDLKSFYASVECVERGLDPLKAKLVVADPDRSKNTICLAVTPAMKALGVRNRCRIGEIPQSLDYITAKPRMRLYLDYSARVYAVYLSYFAKEDIHVYSVDEAFLDTCKYLRLYRTEEKAMAKQVMADIYKKTGLRATCGIGTNLYLAKIALDILAKHAEDFIGVLDETSYRERLWQHRPLSDFWRIGGRIEKRLEKYGLTTMERIARADEDFLYRLFGVDAELLIDHAWGRETATMEDIKAYRPKNSSLSNGQVLMRDYTFREAKLVIREMTDMLVLDLFHKDLVTSSVSLYVGYSRRADAGGAKGTASFPETNSAAVIIPAIMELYDRIVDPQGLIRRLHVCCGKVECRSFVQLSLFDGDLQAREREKRMQAAILQIKEKYGKNALVKGMDLTEEGTTMERNNQIGGHRA